MLLHIKNKSKPANKKTGTDYSDLDFALKILELGYSIQFYPHSILFLKEIHDMPLPERFVGKKPSDDAADEQADQNQNQKSEEEAIGDEAPQSDEKLLKLWNNIKEAANKYQDAFTSRLRDPEEAEANYKEEIATTLLEKNVLSRSHSKEKFTRHYSDFVYHSHVRNRYAVESPESTNLAWDFGGGGCSGWNLEAVGFVVPFGL